MIEMATGSAMPNNAIDRRPTLAFDTDLMVVGGGAAGLAAAVTAARAGLQVILLERYGFCGGAAVAGLSGTVCGLYAASEDVSRPPEQLVFGFAEEFIALLRSRGGITDPIRYGKTFTLVHDPLMWREAADHLLTGASVTVLYHALVTATLCNGDKVEGVEAWTKQGRARVTAKLTIDASGDADVAAMAGRETFMGHDGAVQNPTMIFRLAGVDVERFRARFGLDSILGDDVSQMIRNLQNSREYNLPRA
jgi:flavin-dependent dehydrogenase